MNELNFLNKVFYSQKAKQYPLDSPRRLGWSSAKSQFERFLVLDPFITPLESNNLILDMGCGTGDLYGYLYSKGVKIGYIGCDIVESNISIARKKFPEISFVCADFMSSPFSIRGDIVFGSGLFGLHTATWEDDVVDITQRLISLSRELVIVNFLSSSTVDKKKGWHYVSEEEILEILSPIGNKKMVLNHYTSKNNDITAIISV